MSEENVEDNADGEETKKKKKKKKSGGKLVFFLIVISLLLIVFTQMTYVFLIIGLLPSIVAYYIDTSEGRNHFHTVFACNLSGVLPFVVELIVNGNSTSDMQMMLSDIEVLFIMYLSAGFGWVLHKGMPHLAALLIDSLNNRQIARYRARQKKMVREWGPDVTSPPSV